MSGRGGDTQGCCTGSARLRRNSTTCRPGKGFPLKLSNYSLNYSGLIGRGEMDVFRFLGLCRALGLDGASLHVRDLPGTKPDTLARVRRAYLDEGLSVAMVTVSTDFGRPDRRRDDELKLAREAIGIAAFLGAPCCGSSPARWLRRWIGPRPGPARSTACDRSARRPRGPDYPSAFRTTTTADSAAPAPICSASCER